MIELDGSDAGGQMVRTAAALSALTGKAFRINNIRGARPEPGLKVQHIEGINALAELCDAKVKGLSVGSREMEFVPQRLEPKDLNVEMGTAGSVGLVLQALSIVAPGIKDHIHVTFNGGGTWNKWAPPVLYLDKVLNHFVGEILSVEIEREGFYPKGGAKARCVIKPYERSPINVTELGKIKAAEIYSSASEHLRKGGVAERQADEAKSLLSEKFSVPVEVKISYSKSLSPGSGILIRLVAENSVLGADALGERGEPAEQVAREAVGNLVAELGGAVDRHAADMLLPFMALSGGAIRTSRITRHCITNIGVIEKFLSVRFSVEGEMGGPGVIRL
ncbi:MAG: RNA 3'-terminal phosphate cyclase [Candidatus Aenigmatarchaeota archaeon]